MSPRKREPKGPPYHGSTPKSVLEAPKMVPVLVVEQLGFSREERRHGTILSPAARQEAAMFGPNHPHVRATPRKIRRGRMARFNH